MHTCAKVIMERIKLLFFCSYEGSAEIMKFEKEFNFFKENQAELAGKYPGKVLVLCGESVEFVCDTVLDAYLQGQEKFGLGNFAIQRCVADESAYTVRVATIGALGSIR